MANNNTSEGGGGFCGLLTIVFIVLKLTECVDWSWWWVFSPLWIPWAVIGIALVIALPLTLISKART